MIIKKMETKYCNFTYCNWCGCEHKKQYCYVQYGEFLYKGQPLMSWCLDCYLKAKEGLL